MDIRPNPLCDRRHRALIFLLVAALLTARASLRAEDGHAAWLRYAPINDAAARTRLVALPNVIVNLDRSPVAASAAQEIVDGVRGMLGRTLVAKSELAGEGAIVLCPAAALPTIDARLLVSPALKPDAYWLKSITIRNHASLLIVASNDRGLLYGAFAVLRKIAVGEAISGLNERSEPAAPIRWVNQWDNLEGSIERGYGGKSIFFENGHVAPDLARVRDYARLLASLGIDGCAINNVNADPRLLTAAYLPELVRVADAFRPWGVRLAVSADLGSPKSVGGFDTFDPLDPRVAAWWKNTADSIYAAIPDFAGFLVKADSEGRLGPSSYGRSPADAANVVARALAPHAGVLLYRAFVYNHHLDWTNPKNDRARAAYDIFHPLDGQFDPNVVVQIKYGPIDFQVREPASPLLGGLEKTNEAIELQITQEYTGQQRHLCFLAPLWKTILDFDLHARGSGTPVRDVVAGRTFHRPLGGFVGVANVGRDPNWLGSDLAMANLYGFGRLAWNPELAASEIADEWTRQTFGGNAGVTATVDKMLLKSWRIYEDYTGPLGLGTLTDVTGSHYGPNIESAERNGWGQWIRADSEGIGMDRSVATGTGYIGQYRPEVAKMYESLATCPDELLLFMRHVPYTYKLHSGETVIQHVYDSHYAGAEEVDGLVREWQALNGLIDDERFGSVHAALEYQAGAARVWRDAVCSWFLRESGIPDARGRAGHFPNRIEAEGMKLDGYNPVDVTPWETASGGKAVECGTPRQHCSASLEYQGPAGRYDLSVEYFDQNNGVSSFAVYVSNRLIDHWLADDHLPSTKPDGASSTRRVIRGLTLSPGDQIRIEGTPDGPERAPLDDVELNPAS